MHDVCLLQPKSFRVRCFRMDLKCNCFEKDVKAGIVLYNFDAIDSISIHGAARNSGHPNRKTLEEQVQRFPSHLRLLSRTPPILIENLSSTVLPLLIQNNLNRVSQVHLSAKYSFIAPTNCCKMETNSKIWNQNFFNSFQFFTE